MSATVDVMAPTAQVIAAKVSPNGNILWLYGANLGGEPSAVTGADLSLTTVVKNGGSPISLAGLSPMYDGYDPWCWVFLGQPAQDIQIGDTDAACVKTGAGWTLSADTDQSSLFQNFNPSVALSGANTGKGTIGFTATHTESAVYTISDLVVGCTYKVYRNSPDVYTANPQGNQNAQQIHGTATTHANYAIFDGSATANYAVDQTAVGSFDDVAPFYRWTLIGSFTAAATSATVTVTNANSSGVLYTNGIRCVLQPAPFIQSGDTLVVNVGDSALTTAAGLPGTATLTATLQTDDQWFPFDPALPRALLGYNTGGLRQYNNGHPLANRAKYCGWGANYGVTVDSNGQLTSNCTTAGHPATMQALGGALNGIANGNGEDYWGNPADKAGVWTLRFTVPVGGNPTVYFSTSAPWSVTSAGKYGPGGTSGQSGDNGGAPIEFQITVTQTQPTNPIYTPQIDLICAPNGNPSLDIIQNLWIGDPNTPDTTPTTQVTHPVRLTRIGNNFPGGFLRHMNDLNIVSQHDGRLGRSAPADGHRLLEQLGLRDRGDLARLPGDERHDLFLVGTSRLRDRRRGLARLESDLRPDRDRARRTAAPRART